MLHVLNLKSIDQIFSFWVPVNNYTCFDNIYELKPGSYMVFEGQKPRIQSYWNWPFPSNQTKLTHNYQETLIDFKEKY